MQNARLLRKNGGTINPVVHILHIFNGHRVRYLLMGGQACILYSGTEFSRDTDFCILCDAENIKNITGALKALKAENVFFPPLEPRFLEKGHACHFICGCREALGFRIDIMSVMRNCPGFDELWVHRKLLSIGRMQRVPVIGIRHLVAAKKTQRDKDWPMIRRLIEADHDKSKKPGPDDIHWWFLESRTPSMLFELAAKHPAELKKLLPLRPLLRYAAASDTDGIETALYEEEKEERRRDKAYWDPLKKELEQMRHERK